MYIFRHTETGLAPLAVAAATIASSIFSRIGGVLTWAATLSWVTDALGDDDETLQPKIQDPLTNNARKYYINVDLANWTKVAKARFTGSRLSAALKAVEQGKKILQEPDATMLTMLATMKSINVLFGELRKKQDAATKKAKSSSSKKSSSKATSSSTPAGQGWTGGATSNAPPRATYASQNMNAWPWLLGAAGLGAWMWHRRKAS